MAFLRGRSTSKLVGRFFIRCTAWVQLISINQSINQDIVKVAYKSISARVQKIANRRFSSVLKCLKTCCWDDVVRQRISDVSSNRRIGSAVNHQTVCIRRHDYRRFVPLERRTRRPGTSATRVAGSPRYKNLTARCRVELWMSVQQSCTHAPEIVVGGGWAELIR